MPRREKIVEEVLLYSSNKRKRVLVKDLSRGRSRTLKKTLKNANNKSVIAQMKAHSRFTEVEIVRLIEMHKTICLNGRLDNNLFREAIYNAFGIESESMVDRLFIFFDHSRTGLISTSEWVNGLDALIFGSLEEKIDIAFQVYDLTEDGYISREEMVHMLADTMAAGGSHEDDVREMVDFMMRKIDKDTDGKLSMDDFREATLEQPLLLEGLGRWLPDPEKIQSYASIFMEEVPSHSTLCDNMFGLAKL